MRVQAEALPWNSDEQRQFFVINLEGDSPGFDVMMLDVIWVPEFARAGWLLDLTPRLAADELAAFFPSTVEAATYGGRIWGMPWNMNVGLLYYRSDLLAKYGLAPPATWTELVAAGRARSAPPRGTRGSTAVLWQGKQYEGLMVNVLEGLWADGTELLGAGGAVFPDPARARGGARASCAGLITQRREPAVDHRRRRGADAAGLRRRGEAVFLRSWPYALDLLRASRLARARARGHRASPAPRRRGAAARARRAASHLAIHRGTRHPELALELVRALTSEPAQRLMVDGRRALPDARGALPRARSRARASPRCPPSPR